MTAHLMEPLGPAGTATNCPGCGSGHTVWVSTAVRDSLLCKTCGSCWYNADGHVEQTDVLTCPGCEFRDVCLAAHG